GEVVQACTARWPLLNREAVAALVQAHRGDPIHGDGLWALLVLAEWCAGLRLDQMAASDGLVELAYSRS
ncbi:MAG TPA: hypothetical protein VK196_20970, partial [Magnetospirillum sp.]|nr:hypothetical protein [Magnetospirillum sp.]